MRNILVVEDTPAMQRFLEEVFVRNGDRVEMAGNGIEAVARIRRKPFDAVVMDLEMPLMNGFQAAMAIRLMPDETRSSVPIVAISGHTEPELAVACIDAGMDELLIKPINPEVLVQSVERLATHTRQRAKWRVLQPDYMPQARTFSDAVSDRPRLIATEPAGSQQPQPQQETETSSDSELKISRQQVAVHVPPNQTEDQWIENREYQDRNHQYRVKPVIHRIPNHSLKNNRRVTIQPLFDAQRVMSNLGVDRPLLMMLAGFSIESVPVLLEDLTQAMKRQNSADVQRKAHSLRGLAATFSPPEILDLARQIELAAQRGDLDEAAEFLEPLHRGLEQLTLELRAYRQSEVDEIPKSKDHVVSRFIGEPQRPEGD